MEVLRVKDLNPRVVVQHQYDPKSGGATGAYISLLTDSIWLGILFDWYLPTNLDRLRATLQGLPVGGRVTFNHDCCERIDDDHVILFDVWFDRREEAETYVLADVFELIDDVQKCVAVRLDEFPECISDA